MKRRILSQISGVFAIAGAIVSTGALVWLLFPKPNLLELSYLILLIVIGGLVGVFSQNIANLLNRLRTSPRVFISYSKQDGPVAHAVADALRSQGALVWMDQERIKPGEKIRDAVERAIQDSRTLIVLLSERSSPDLPLELELAKKAGLRVIPALVANTEMPPDLSGIRYVDLRHEREQGIEELARAAV